MRQMNELFNKHERVWFSLLGEESQRQFLQAIHDYDPAIVLHRNPFPSY